MEKAAIVLANKQTNERGSKARNQNEQIAQTENKEAYVFCSFAPQLAR